ncbi:hypothetical protein F5J12DRAFT_891296 [Pisolithus orientalis]|uniref:uncharacterized protein n=1 Tax=Pisolithus orientalis TaxID=936130 RepID=UPI002224F06F|nr:uncharacterized protein F5J12DRAFT_891296 [Pisolithus orientalis]KAI6010795.1 hypothetical protein F5J12DRAFT_891296 [Pisolithus orientalis]
MCWLLLNKDFSAKLHDQLIHVHGFTLVNKLAKSLQPSIFSDMDPSFVVSNPFITHICLNDQTTSSALVHSTNIYKNGIVCNDIHIKTLHVNRSKIKVSGNVLILIPSELNLMWIWMVVYLKALSPVPGLAVTTQKVIEISTTKSLVELVNPNVIMASAHLPSDKAKENNSQDLI